MTQFTVRSLKTNELAEAWPIVRSSNVHANLDWWLCEAVELIANGGGVLVAIAPDDAIHGVATFKVPAGPARDSELVVPMLITFELSSWAPAGSALVKALERIATRLECTQVVLPLAGNFDTPHAGKVLAAEQSRTVYVELRRDRPAQLSYS